MLFKHRPVEVEAEQYYPDRQPWPTGVVFEPSPNPLQQSGRVVVYNLGGQPRRVQPSDWVVTREGEGRFVVNNAEFVANYEPAQP